jgi:carbonic anhydrase
MSLLHRLFRITDPARDPSPKVRPPRFPTLSPSAGVAGSRRHPSRIRIELERLETKVMLSAGSHAHPMAAPGTIGGHVALQANGSGVAHVQIDLINKVGRTVARTTTNAAGDYSFHVRRPGPYVVREVTPRGMTQVFPTFGSFLPAGAYAPGRGSKSWNYSSANTDPAAGAVGPSAWGTIAPAGDLPFESPIILHGPTVNLDNVLSIHYVSTVPSGIIDNGKQIQVQYNKPSSNDSITVGGVSFDLSQFHYHDPAENLINKYQYAMEEHFVNVSASGAEAVVAVFLRIGAHNNALDPILNAAYSKLQSSGTTAKITTPIDFSGLLPSDHQGWYYVGSLTTPPLSQPVYWLVYKSPITLDINQFGEYQQIANAGGFLPNARPNEPVLGRPLNEIDNQVDYVGGSMSNVNFIVAPG